MSQFGSIPINVSESNNGYISEKSVKLILPLYDLFLESHLP